MAKTNQNWKPNPSDRAVCEALIQLIRAGKVIPLQDPDDPLGMRLASAERPANHGLKRLSADEACRRLKAANN